MQTFAQYANLGLCTVHISCKRSTVEIAVLYIHMHFAHGTTAENEVEKRTITLKAHAKCANVFVEVRIF